MPFLQIFQPNIWQFGFFILHLQSNQNGGIAQLVEHLLCKQGVKSSNLFISTKKDNRKVVLFSFLPLSLFATLGFFGYLCTF